MIKYKYRDKIRNHIRKNLTHSLLCSFLTLTGCSKTAHLGMQNVEGQQGSIDLASNRLHQNLMLLEDARASGLVVAEGVVPEDSSAIGKPFEDPDVWLPEGALIGLIKRQDNTYTVPRGQTLIQAEDKVMVIADSQEKIDKVKDTLGIRNLSQLHQNRMLLEDARDSGIVKVVEGIIPETSSAIGKPFEDPKLRLPDDALIGLIKRQDTYIVPRGKIIIEALDEVIIIAKGQEKIDEVKKTLGM